MAQIQYTPYVNQIQVQPNPIELDRFDVPIIKTAKKPKEEIVLAPLPQTKEPIVEISTPSIDWNDSSRQGKSRSARDYLMSGLGLTKAQASGIIANLLSESGLNANAENSAEKAGKNSSVSSSQYGIGIGQWTGKRHNDYVNWTGTHGNSLQSQLDFAMDEIQKKYPEFLTAIRTAETPEEASDYTYAMYIAANHKNVNKNNILNIISNIEKRYDAKHKEMYGRTFNNHSDRRRRTALEVMGYKDGSILKSQKGGKVPYVNLDPTTNKQPYAQFFTITKKERIPGQYVRQYDLSDKPKTKTEGYLWPEQQIKQNPVERTIEDLAKFTGGFETFNPDAYVLNTSDGKPQTLAGYGSANPKIIELAKQGKLTEEIARKEMERHLQSEYDEWMKKVPNFKNLSRGIQLALVDTSYNGKGVSGTINGSPKLMKMINSGITDPKELVKEMDHSKDAGGWLGVRSAARRAMALDEYDWDWKTLDRFGRQVDYNKYKGPQDWKSSPYYNNY